MRKMKPVMLIFASWLSVSLLESPSCDAYVFCRTRDLIQQMVKNRHMRKRGVTVVEGPSQSELTQETTSTADEDESLAELIRKRRSDAADQWDGEELLTDYESMASAGQGLSHRGKRSGQPTPRPILRKSGWVYRLLTRCCVRGCSDQDIADAFNPYLDL